MKHFLIFLFALAPALSHAFSMNDLTILLPLPTVDDYSSLLSPQSHGDKGTLLPKEVYSRLPRLLPDEETSSLYKNMLRVIAIRLDPCFAEGSGPVRCKRQIRLVWQPLFESDGEMITRDAAIHTFYEFNESEWQQVLDSWKQISRTDTQEPLQVHPTILAEGYTGTYWNTLKKVLLKNCGNKNLTRATAMNVMNGEQVWIFAGMDVTATELIPIQIPRIGRTAQGIIMGTANTDEFTGSMRPPPTQDPELEALLQDSRAMKLNERETKELIRRIYAYENPKLNNPGTLDCVSCHVAQSARQWAENTFAHWDWENDIQKFAYVASQNTANSSGMMFKANHFRALGYFQKQPMISQRVSNETAETSATLKLDSF